MQVLGMRQIFEQSLRMLFRTAPLWTLAFWDPPSYSPVAMIAQSLSSGGPESQRFCTTVLVTPPSTNCGLAQFKRCRSR